MSLGTPSNLQISDADVLIVEDDPLAATFLRGLIVRDTPLTALTCDAGETAIRVLRRAAADQGGVLPKALVTDMILRDGDASPLIGWVRTSAVTLGLPVLAISSDESAAMKQRALDAGASMFVGKTKIMRELIGWINRVVSDEAMRKAADAKRAKEAGPAADANRKPAGSAA